MRCWSGYIVIVYLAVVYNFSVARANILGSIARPIGGFLSKFFRRNDRDQENQFPIMSEADFRIEELEAENNMLRDQVMSLKRLSMNQKEYARRLVKDKEQLRRLLESSLRDTEEKLQQQFLIEKTEALKEQQRIFDVEKAKWQKELKEVKEELSVASKSLNEATVTIKTIKLKLKQESERAIKAEEAVKANKIDKNAKVEMTRVVDAEEETISDQSLRKRKAKENKSNHVSDKGRSSNRENSSISSDQSRERRQKISAKSPSSDRKRGNF